jgi:hypothetical protein
MDVSEGAAKVAGTAIEAMRSVPLAIALLVVNAGFLGVATYVLGEVATNAGERNKAQLELINNLVRDCRQTLGGQTLGEVR